MGNAIDCSITVIGDSGMLSGLRRRVREDWCERLHAKEDDGRVDLRLPLPEAWGADLDGASPCLRADLQTRNDPPDEDLLHASAAFPGLTFKCSWVDCTGGRAGLVIARSGRLLVVDEWPDSVLVVDAGPGFGRIPPPAGPFDADSLPSEEAVRARRDGCVCIPTSKPVTPPWGFLDDGDEDGPARLF